MPLVEHAFLEFGPREFASPVVTPDRQHVIVGTGKGRLVLLRASSGEVVWTRLVDGGIRAAPLVTREELFVGTDNGALYRISSCDGKPLWEKPARIPAAVRSTPVLWKGQVLIVLDDGSVLHAISAITGESLAEFDEQSFSRRGLSPFTILGYSTPVLSGDMLYVGFETGFLDRFDLSIEDDGTFSGFTTMREIGPCAPGRLAPIARGGDAPALCSSRRVFRDVDTTPVVLSEGILSGCYCRGLFLVDHELSMLVWEAPVLGPSAPLVAGDRAYVTSADGAAYAVEVTSGRILWTSDLGVSLLSPPVLVGNPEVPQEGTLVIATGTTLYALAADSGRILDRITSLGGVSAAPAVLGNALFILSNEGVLYRAELFR